MLFSFTLGWQNTGTSLGSKQEVGDTPRYLSPQGRGWGIRLAVFGPLGILSRHCTKPVLQMWETFSFFLRLSLSLREAIPYMGSSNQWSMLSFIPCILYIQQIPWNYLAPFSCFLLDGSSWLHGVFVVLPGAHPSRPKFLLSKTNAHIIAWES